MERCMKEVRAVVEELPGNAQEIWNRAFQDALLEVQGDIRKAAAMAWKAFKGKGKGNRTDKDWDSEKAARGMLLVAAYGGTPEWIRLAENYGLVLDDCRCPCLVDRRAMDAIVNKWEQWEADLMVYLEDHKVNDEVVSVVGRIKEMKCRSDGLWIRVEWTEKGLGCITRKEFGYLSLEFILDEGNRPVELKRAKLTNYPIFNQWGQEVGVNFAKGAQSEIGRKFRLIKGVHRLEAFESGENREDLKQAIGGKEEEDNEIRQFLLEMKDLLYLHGKISLKKVKQAIVDLKTQQEICQGLKGLDGMSGGPMCQGVIGKPIEEVIAKDLLEPEQRTLARIKANREFQEFKEFLEQGARGATTNKKMKRGFPFFRSLLKWALRKPHEDDHHFGCR
jgi:Mu-like prophage I protein